MPSLLFGLIILIVIVGFLFWLLEKAPLAEPFRTIAKGICVFVLILYIIYVCGSLLGVSWPPLRNL